MTLTVASPPTDLRIRDAVLVCIARFGLAKTTLDDVAREAGCSRATLYRYFDGKPASSRAAVAAELDRVTAALVDAGHAESTFADAVVAVVMPRRARAPRPRRAAVPARARTGAVLGHLTFGPGDRVLVAVGDASRPRSTAGSSPAACTRAPATGSRGSSASYVLMPAPARRSHRPAAARAFLERLVVPASSAGLTESRS